MAVWRHGTIDHLFLHGLSSLVNILQVALPGNDGLLVAESGLQMSPLHLCLSLCSLFLSVESAAGVTSQLIDEGTCFMSSCQRVNSVESFSPASRLASLQSRHTYHHLPCSLPQFLPYFFYCSTAKIRYRITHYHRRCTISDCVYICCHLFSCCSSSFWTLAPSLRTAAVFILTLGPSSSYETWSDTRHTATDSHSPLRLALALVSRV